MLTLTSDFSFIGAAFMRRPLFIVERSDNMTNEMCECCAQNSRTRCHCLEVRMNPCSFFADNKIYHMHKKSGFILKEKEKAVKVGERWLII